LRVKCERSAVKNDFVLAANQVRIQQGATNSTRPLRHPGLALAGFVDVKRRGIQHAKHLGSSLARSLRGFLEPGVFANQHANAQAFDVHHQRALPGVTTRSEIAPFVEDLVVGQFALAVSAQDQSPGKHRGRIEALLHGQRLRPNIASRSELMRMPNDQMQPRAIGQFLRQSSQRVCASGHEGWAQQQVFWRIAGQRQLGRQHQLGTLRVGAARGLRQQPGIASQVSDLCVDLRKSGFQRSAFTLISTLFFTLFSTFPDPAFHRSK